MKKTLLGIVVAMATPFAAQAASCDQTYVTSDGVTLSEITEMAYAAPMLTIVASRNPHIESVHDRLPAGVVVTLPCLHNLPQFTPQLTRLRGYENYRVVSL